MGPSERARRLSNFGGPALAYLAERRLGYAPGPTAEPVQCTRSGVAAGTALAAVSARVRRRAPARRTPPAAQHPAQLAGPQAALRRRRRPLPDRRRAESSLVKNSPPPRSRRSPSRVGARAVGVAADAGVRARSGPTPRARRSRRPDRGRSSVVGRRGPCDCSRERRRTRGRAPASDCTVATDAAPHRATMACAGRGVTSQSSVGVSWLRPLKRKPRMRTAGATTAPGVAPERGDRLARARHRRRSARAPRGGCR